MAYSQPKPKDSLPINSKGLADLFADKNSSTKGKQSFELNPHVVPFVNDYLALESGEFEKMKTWAKPYFALFDNILAANAVPVQLKYLAVIESHLQSTLLSDKGALGPWQLMPEEAQRLGLAVRPGSDERTNYAKSTEAAAKLLKELYTQFNDWLLVVAAYNGGPGAVINAISKSGSNDFYKLEFYLPEETRNHVKKYIATHYYFEGGGGWTTLTADETKEKQMSLLHQNTDSSAFANTAVIAINGRYNSVVIAQTLMMDIHEFNQLNPFLDNELAEGNTYQLRLPETKIELFKAKKQQILQQSVQLFLSSVPR